MPYEYYWSGSKITKGLTSLNQLHERLTKELNIIAALCSLGVKINFDASDSSQDYLVFETDDPWVADLYGFEKFDEDWHLKIAEKETESVLIEEIENG